MTECVGVADDAGGLKAAGSAIVEVGFDGGRKARRGFCSRLGFRGRPAAGFERGEAVLCLRPTPRLHGTPVALTEVVVAVHPDHAGAGYVADALLEVTTPGVGGGRLLMASVEGVHGGILPQSWYILWYTGCWFRYVVDLIAFSMGRLVGLVPYYPSICQQLKQDIPSQFPQCSPLAPGLVRHGTFCGAQI